MSLIAIGMNLLLVGLLLAALVVGLRLNKRLKAFKDSQAGFESAVVQLNLAAQRAEQGLADLRAATDEATDLLSDRIEKGRTLALKLEKLVASAPELSRAMAPERAQPRSMPPVAPPLRETSAEQRLSNLIAMARSRIAAETGPIREAAGGRAAAPSPEPMVGRAPIPGRRIASIDDDLFEDEPLTLDRFANERVLGGARR
jgi:hypothetical protein